MGLGTSVSERRQAPVFPLSPGGGEGEGEGAELMRTITGIDLARRLLTSRAAYAEPVLPLRVSRPGQHPLPPLATSAYRETGRASLHAVPLGGKGAAIEKNAPTLDP